MKWEWQFFSCKWITGRCGQNADFDSVGPDGVEFLRFQLAPMWWLHYWSMSMDHTLSSKLPKPYVHVVDEASMGSSRKTGSHGYVCKMVGEEFQHVAIFISDLVIWLFNSQLNMTWKKTFFLILWSLWYIWAGILFVKKYIPLLFFHFLSIPINWYVF